MAIHGPEVLTVGVSLLLPSAANAREHWAARARRVRGQREAVGWHLLSSGRPPRGPRWVVTIVRIAPRALDSDNLTVACKAVRDAVATWLGVDDGPAAPVEWRYGQERCRRGAEVVRIQVEGESDVT